jgi:predicted nuclease of predicted toxin-antitoxin system
VRIILDRGVPVPLRRFLAGHDVATAWQKGWSKLSNGDLVAAAEAEGFDLLVTTDQNLRYQQDLRGRKLAILVLMIANWAALQPHGGTIATAASNMNTGEYREWSP